MARTIRLNVDFDQKNNCEAGKVISLKPLNIMKYWKGCNNSFS